MRTAPLHPSRWMQCVAGVCRRHTRAQLHACSRTTHEGARAHESPHPCSCTCARGLARKRSHWTTTSCWNGRAGARSKAPAASFAARRAVEGQQVRGPKKTLPVLPTVLRLKPTQSSACMAPSPCLGSQRCVAAAECPWLPVPLFPARARAGLRIAAHDGTRGATGMAAERGEPRGESRGPRQMGTPS